jgi:hypothetical protein
MDFDQLAKKTREIFVVPRPPEEVTRAVSALLDHLDNSCKSIALAFLENIQSALSTLTMPFNYSWSTVYNLHRQRLFLAERIRSGGIDAEEGEDEAKLEMRRTKVAIRIAAERLRDFTESEEGLEVLPSEICWHLLRSTENPELLAAAQELTRQGAILIWSAFEVLARDLFTAILNQRPGAVNLLINSAARRRFLTAKFELETLAAYDFDLSRSLGTILSQYESLNDLPGVKDVYLALFPGRPALVASLSDPCLWLLFQRRNLIVHRRGIVDDQYRDKTGDNKPIGERLLVVPQEVDCYIDSVVAAGAEMLDATVLPREGE